MSLNSKSPLPTTDLSDNAAWPFQDGCEEITIRVSRYGPDGKTPAAYQAIARAPKPSRNYGLGVRTNPVAAVQAAIETFFAPKAAKSEPVEVGDLLA